MMNLARGHANKDFKLMNLSEFVEESVSKNQQKLFKNIINVNKNVLVYKRHNALVVLESYETMLLQYLHANIYHHFGVGRIINSIKKQFYFLNMSNKLNKISNACEICKQAKGNTNKKIENKSIIVPQPNHTITLDMMGKYSSTEYQNQWILHIMDKFSRYSMTIPLPNKEAGTVLEALHRHWITKIGIPVNILTDNGKEFINKKMKKYCDNQGITQLHTSIYHPEGNGMNERHHGFIKHQLRMFKLEHEPLVDNDQFQWDRYFDDIEYLYNNSFNPLLGCTPYSLIYGLPKTLNFIYLNGIKTNTWHPISAMLCAEELKKRHKQNLSDAAKKHSLEFRKCVMRTNPDPKKMESIKLYDQVKLLNFIFNKKGFLQKPLFGPKWIVGFYVTKTYANGNTFDLFNDYTQEVVKCIHVKYIRKEKI